jgi:ribonucleoside-diphosphate reductase alpha chain
MLDVALSTWDEAVELSEMFGVRNCQASVLAPTGTIGLMMDCDTTGIEPDLGLVKIKKLVGGGKMSIVNQTVPRALKTLGYTKTQTDDIIDYIDREKTIKDAPHLKKIDHSVFACSMGDNTIHYLGHVKMMAAVQPFLSGAISKTVNLPEDITVEDIEQLHIDAWKMGLKAVAIYRDNCKVAQPLSTVKNDRDNSLEPNLAINADTFIVKGAVKRDLPRKRNSHTYKFRISDLKGYFTIGEYEDGSPGELFISVAKQGSTLSGLMDSFAISISHGLQYGVPLKSYVRTLMGTSFAPSGITDDKEIRMASSLTDYIFRRLALDYLSFDDRLELGLASVEDMNNDQITLPMNEENYNSNLGEVKSKHSHKENSELNIDLKEPELANNMTAPLCYNCGNQTQKAGSCYVCTACGSTTGCS